MKRKLDGFEEVVLTRVSGGRPLATLTNKGALEIGLVAVRDYELPLWRYCRLRYNPKTKMLAMTLHEKDDANGPLFFISLHNKHKAHHTSGMRIGGMLSLIKQFRLNFTPTRLAITEWDKESATIFIDLSSAIKETMRPIRELASSIETHVLGRGH